MPCSAMTLEATGLPAAGAEEAWRLLARADARLRARLGDDHVIALPQLAADDFRRRAVVEPDAEGHRRGLAVAQDPHAPRAGGGVHSTRGSRGASASGAAAQPRAFRQEAQRLLGHHQYVVALRLDDARRRGHPWLAGVVGIAQRHDHVVRYAVLTGDGSLPHLAHGALELAARERLNRERRAVTDLDAADVRLAHVGVDLHLGEVGGDQE